MNLKLINVFIFIILFFIIYIIYTCEQFKSDSINIMDTNIFNNKELFIIASNSNISKKTRQFLDDYDYKNALVIRFNNGLVKEGVKELCKGKTDIIIYRYKGNNSYHGFNKQTYLNTKDKVISVFQPHAPDIINEKINYHISNKKIFKTASAGLSTGFNFIYQIYNKINKIKKIYLIGFTFHGKTNNHYHSELSEHNYFKKNIEPNKKIKVLI